MSKKILKRSMALGALMAFVITGSAMAADYSTTVENWDTDMDGFNNSITYDNITITNNHGYDDGKNKGAVDVKNSTVLKAKGKIEILTDGWESGIILQSNPSNKKVEVSAPIIIMKNIGSQSGIHVHNDGGSAIVEGFKNFSIYKGSEFKSENGHLGGNGIRVLGSNASVTVKGDVGSTIEIDVGQSGIVMDSGKEITLSAGTINILTAGTGYKADKVYKGHAVANTSSGTIKIWATDKISLSNDNIEKKDSVCAVYSTDGTIYIGTAENAEKKATVEVNGNVQAKDDGYIDLKLETKDSVLNGAVKDESINKEGKGTDLLLGGGAIWNNPENSSVTRLTLDDGVVKQVSEGKSVEVGTLSGKGTFEVENATPKQMVIEEKENTELTVSTKNKDVEAKDLVSVAVMKSTEKTAADFVEKTGGPIYSSDKYAVVDGKLGENTKVVDSANLGVRDMAALSLMSWRAETNDVNKRMGELRNANGEHGVWVRMVGGEDEYKSTEYEYTQYQLGYDEKLSTDPSWTVGVALNYTDGDVKFTNGSGEIENKGVSIYGSKLNEDGSFIDLIAKYSRVENDFKTISGMGEGDYGTNAYSFSAEYGKRFEQGKGLWIEPQVELTYGKVSAVDYVTKEGVAVAQDGMESLVGRIGFSLGKNIKQGNVYARASYLYDFDGETKAVLGGVEPLESDLGGGWWEVGVGTNINLSKATYIYADIEKTFGGEVDTNWQWNLGVRYSF